MAFTFTVEDGTGLSTANSYLSTADFIDYWDGRGTDYSGEVTGDLEDALVQATQYIDTHYWFPGYRSSSDQALQWPRSNAYDQDGYNLSGIPTRLADSNVSNAVAEAGKLVMDGEDLFPGLDRGGGIKREKVDVLELEYFDNARPYKTYKHVDQIMLGYGIAIGVVGASNQKRVVRI